MTAGRRTWKLERGNEIAKNNDGGVVEDSGDDGGDGGDDDGDDDDDGDEDCDDNMQLVNFL